MTFTFADTEKAEIFMETVPNFKAVQYHVEQKLNGEKVDINEYTKNCDKRFSYNKMLKICDERGVQVLTDERNRLYKFVQKDPYGKSATFLGDIWNSIEDGMRNSLRR